MISLMLASALTLGAQQIPVPPAPEGVQLELRAYPERIWKANPRAPNYSLTFVNKSKVPITINRATFWPNHKIMLVDASGSELPLSKAGTQMRQFLVTLFQSRNHNIPKVVPPGTSFAYDAERIILDDLYDLTPGKYFLKIEYYEQASPQMGLWSNRVPFEKRPDSQP